MPRRTRLTPRGAAVLAAAALVVAALGAVVLLRSGGPACEVGTGDDEVGLTRTQAEQAARTVAAVVRRSGSAGDAQLAVLAHLDLSPHDAGSVAAALSGRARAALSCDYEPVTTPASDSLGADGLTRRAEVVRADVATHFGRLPLGGFAPGGVHSGHMPGSAHYEGRAIDAFFRPITAADKQRGWALAQYLVANAARLELNTVIFDARIWTAAKSDQGWREYHVDRGTSSAATYRILEHRDHVHVDVAD